MNKLFISLVFVLLNASGNLGVAAPIDIAIDIDSEEGIVSSSGLTTQPGFRSWPMLEGFESRYKGLVAYAQSSMTSLSITEQGVTFSLVDSQVSSPGWALS